MAEVSESRIQVIIRVRPLNSFELSRKCKCILQHDGDQKLTVWDPACFDAIQDGDVTSIDPSCWSRDFTFDRCLWSINERDENYASQDTVFDSTSEILLLINYHICLCSNWKASTGMDNARF